MVTGSIRERNGRYYVRTRVLVVDPQTGRSRWKQVEKAAGSSRREAQAALREIQGAVHEGRFLPSSMTVAELGRKWLFEHVQPNLKPGAAASYKGTFYGHVAPTLAARRLDDCTPQLIRALLGRKREEGLSGETVAKIRRQIHAMFAFAQDEGLVSVNPADGARVRGRRQANRRTRGTELSPAQIKRLLDACPPRWRLFFTVALDTGLRRGELVGLRWGDVDLLQRIIYIRRSIGAYDKPNDLPDRDRRLTTKTEAGQRLVPILDGAQAALEALYTAAADSSDGAPVFATLGPRAEQRRRRCYLAAARSRREWSRECSAATQSAQDSRPRFAFTTSATLRSRMRSARARTSSWSRRSPDTRSPRPPSTCTGT